VPCSSGIARHTCGLSIARFAYVEKVDNTHSAVFGCASLPASRLANYALEQGWQVRSSDKISVDESLLVGLFELSQGDVTADVHRRFPHALLVVCCGVEIEGNADFEVDPDNYGGFLPQLFSHAGKFWKKNKKVHALVRDVAMRRQRMHQLNEISLALTGQMSQQELLQTILSEARRIAGCEGGSLFLVDDEGPGEDMLVFKLAQNDAVSFPYVETRLPLTAESIAGYVAVTGSELNIQDVYSLREDLPYKFNPSFDDSMGYRTRSMFTLPMRDHRGRVVGVLQFINRLSQRTQQVASFGEETAEVLRAIASQAAMSLQKNTLLEDINELFESFVQASVKTIERRDPSTSGHSFRVAQTTVALLQSLPNSGLPQFKSLVLSAEHIREVRYAALLHDFGKIGVPEAILIKANKLSDERLEIIHYRVELQKERLKRRAVEQEIELLHHNPVDHEVARRRVHRKLDKQLSVLSQYYEWVLKANNPNVIDAGEFGHLEEIRDYAFRELDGTVGGVITDQDVLALSIRRGSLTPEERRKIQAHVVYTTEFLSVLPWPPELAQVPKIAGAHHERIDGSGYPQGLVGEQIPLASRVMAVCDVYDALTAMDRPYKPAMGTDTAFAILQDEARRGLLDTDMVNIFIASGSHNLAQVI